MTRYESMVLWLVEKTAPNVYDDIWNEGFKASIDESKDFLIQEPGTSESTFSLWGGNA